MPIPRALVLVSQQFGAGALKVAAPLEGLSDDDFFRSPEKMNHMLWLLGHVANSRLGLVGMLGGPSEHPWNHFFGKGSQPDGADKLPSASDVRDFWTGSVDALNAQFEQVPADVLSSPAPRDLPIADKTLLGAAAFLATHELYHAGQMAALRSWLGHHHAVG
jgi:hypothetical protein